MKVSKEFFELEVRYSTSDNITLSGLLTLPEKVKRPPVVILAHGFCGNKNEKGFFVQAAKSFYKHGYAVIRFDFRGCGNSDGDFVNVRLADKRLDLTATVDFIKSQNKLLDSDRIAFVGFSLGATLGLLSDIPDFKTLAFWSPAFFPCNDMYPRYINEDVVREINQKGYFVKSNLKVSKLFLEDLALCDTTTQIESIDKPVLVIHGRKDKRISWKSTEIAFNMLKQKNNDKLIKYIDDGHSFKENLSNRSVVINSTIKWFDYYLKPSLKLMFKIDSHETISVRNNDVLPKVASGFSYSHEQFESSWSVLGASQKGCLGLKKSEEHNSEIQKKRPRTGKLLKKVYA